MKQMKMRRENLNTVKPICRYRSVARNQPLFIWKWKYASLSGSEWFCRRWLQVKMN